MEPRINAKELFEGCLQQASDVVRQVRPEQCDLPTPDSEWTVKDLMRHMFYELAWAADTINGMTIEQVGTKYDGDLFGDELHDSWRALRDRALIALEHAGLQSIAHLSYGDVKLEEYLRQLGADMLIHAWDLGQAIGRPVVFEEELAVEVEAYARERTDMMSRSNLFGPPIEVSEDAPVQERLIGLYGRSADWRNAQ